VNATVAEDVMTTELPTHEQLQARLRRIEGQIRGVNKMLGSERTCEEVVTQLMAVRSGVDTVGALMLDLHLATCLSDKDSETQVNALRDSMRLWWRFAPGASGFAASETVPAEELEEAALETD
jgi:DNA-binding FrmR family transcriptional regulator